MVSTIPKAHSWVTATREGQPENSVLLVLLKDWGKEGGKGQLHWPWGASRTDVDKGQRDSWGLVEAGCLKESQAEGPHKEATILLWKLRQSFHYSGKMAEIHVPGPVLGKGRGKSEATW
jgi:hypothetical protein